MSYMTGAHYDEGRALAHRRNRSTERLVEQSNPISYRFNNGVPNQITHDARCRSISALTWTIKWAPTSGSLDRRSPDAQPRAALRPVPEQLSGAGNRPHAVGAESELPLRENGRGFVQRPESKVERRLRSAGRRQDGGEEPASTGRSSRTLPADWPAHATQSAASQTQPPGRGVMPTRISPPTATFSARMPTANAGRSRTGRSAVSRPNRTSTPRSCRGWGKRSYDWEFTAGVQREIVPRVSVDVTYFRRWYGNFTVVDNRAVTASDFTCVQRHGPFRSTAAGRRSLCDCRAVRRQSGQVRSDRQHHHVCRQLRRPGADVERRRRGRQRAAGQWSASAGGHRQGTLTNDTCEIRAQLPEIAAVNPYCRTEQPATQFKVLGSYTIPSSVCR